MECFHVAEAKWVSVGNVLCSRPPTGLNHLQAQILKDLFPPDGAVSQWGKTMLADRRFTLGHQEMLNLGFASVPGLAGAQPGSDYDRTLHVTPDGVDLMQDTFNRLVEMNLELVRRTTMPSFLTLPSRLTCVFAYRSLAGAEEFLKQRGPGEERRIWRLEVDERVGVHTADRRWLVSQPDMLSFMGVAVAYWQGKRRPGDPPGEYDIETLVPSGAATVKEDVTPLPA